MDSTWLIFTLGDLTIKGGYTWLNSWAPLSALAVMVSLLIHVCLLVVARAFSIKEFENYAMSEILQALAGALMIGALLVMLSSALDLAHGFIAGEIKCGASVKHIGTTNESTMDEAYDAIRCRLQEKAAIVANIQSEKTTGFDAWNKFNQMNAQMSAMGITFLKGDWFGDLYKDTETMRIINNLATVMLIGLNAQSAVLAYMKANMLTMFIPLGVLLRSFYFSRGAGALFLAFGIGMYYIFPVFYVLLDPGFIPAPPKSPEASQPVTIQPYCYATMSSTVSVIKTLQAGGLGTTGGLGNATNRDDLMTVYMELMIHPLVALFLTLVFIRYMMTVLGADAYDVVRMVGKVI